MIIRVPEVPDSARMLCQGSGEPLLISGAAFKRWQRDYLIVGGYGMSQRPSFGAVLLDYLHLDFSSKWSQTARAVGADYSILLLRAGSHFAIEPGPDWPPPRA